MIHYILTVFSWFYSYPFVNKVIKKSIMGHSYDKTIDYYLNTSLISPLEEDFIINFKINSKEYILNCTSETYEKSLRYIKTLSKYPYDDSIFSAYEVNGEDIKDVTEKVRKYAGPQCDFHYLTEFNVTCSEITDYKLFIIKDLKIFSYIGNEYITLRYYLHKLT